jgi:hypothetical protein
MKTKRKKIDTKVTGSLLYWLRNDIGTLAHWHIQTA